MGGWTEGPCRPLRFHAFKNTLKNKIRCCVSIYSDQTLLFASKHRTSVIDMEKFSKTMNFLSLEAFYLAHEARICRHKCMPTRTHFSINTELMISHNFSFDKEKRKCLPESETPPTSLTSTLPWPQRWRPACDHPCLCPLRQPPDDWEVPREPLVDRTGTHSCTAMHVSQAMELELRAAWS